MNNVEHLKRIEMNCSLMFLAENCGLPVTFTYLYPDLDPYLFSVFDREMVWNSDDEVAKLGSSFAVTKLLIFLPRLSLGFFCYEAAAIVTAGPRSKPAREVEPQGIELRDGEPNLPQMVSLTPHICPGHTRPLRSPKYQFPNIGNPEIRTSDVLNSGLLARERIRSLWS